MSFKFSGLNEMRATMLRHAREMPDKLGAAIKAEAEIDATECKKRTPVDTGDLRNSIHVEGPKQQGRNISCQIVAGGIAAEYAIIVHEDLEAFHRVGQAKFIESVINESAPYMTARIAKRLKIEK